MCSVSGMSNLWYMPKKKKWRGRAGGWGAGWGSEEAKRARSCNRAVESNCESLKVLLISLSGPVCYHLKLLQIKEIASLQFHKILTCTKPSTRWSPSTGSNWWFESFIYKSRCPKELSILLDKWGSSRFLLVSGTFLNELSSLRGLQNELVDHGTVVGPWNKLFGPRQFIQ